MYVNDVSAGKSMAFHRVAPIHPRNDNDRTLPHERGAVQYSTHRMQLLIQRIWDTNPECVIGSLYVDGAVEAFTLELPLSFEGCSNVHNKTCIPAGQYTVERLFSPHFNRMMPHIVPVPDRDNIMIHFGNTAKDTDGCLLLGKTRISDRMIGESVIAFEELESKLDSAWANHEEITIEIRNVAFVTTQPSE